MLTFSLMCTALGESQVTVMASPVCTSMVDGVPFPEHKCGHVHISNLSLSCHVLSAAQPLIGPPHLNHPLQQHSSRSLSRKSCSGPRGAVTWGKLSSTTHVCPWSNVAVTRESPERLSSCPQRHRTPITGRLTGATAVTQSRLLCVVPVCLCADGQRGTEGTLRDWGILKAEKVQHPLYSRANSHWAITHSSLHSLQHSVSWTE